MSEIARMRFKSATAPDENGFLVLSDDGTFQIKPSDEFRDTMAALEEKAVKRSERYGVRLGVGFILLGSVLAALGWLAGRIFGSLGSSLSRPRSIQDVDIDHTENGAFAVRMRGVESKFQTINMSWNADEVVQAEADEFAAKFREMKG